MTEIVKTIYGITYKREDGDRRTYWELDEDEGFFEDRLMAEARLRERQGPEKVQFEAEDERRMAKERKEQAEQVVLVNAGLRNAGGWLETHVIEPRPFVSTYGIEEYTLRSRT